MTFKNQITVGTTVLNNVEELKSFLDTNPDNEIAFRTATSNMAPDTVAELLKLAKQVAIKEEGAGNGNANKSIKIAGKVIKINRSDADNAPYNIVLKSNVNVADMLEALLPHADVKTTNSMYELVNDNGDTVFTELKYGNVSSIDIYPNSLNFVVSANDMAKMNLVVGDEMIAIVEKRVAGEEYATDKVYEKTQLNLDLRKSSLKRIDTSLTDAVDNAFMQQVTALEKFINSPAYNAMLTAKTKLYEKALAGVSTTAKYQTTVELGYFQA